MSLDDPTSDIQIADSAAKRRTDAVEGELSHLGVQKLFSGLSENQRLTLRLYFFEGYTLEEIAAKLGHTQANVRHYYFRGLEKLRKQIFRGRSPR
jgi:RNA polymerase sigma factor (sigma-70 family)